MIAAKRQEDTLPILQLYRTNQANRSQLGLLIVTLCKGSIHADH
ncbi:MAG: hypothetical protein Q9P01_17180 [Anaerolineae bacterium]|nr:hypothetical protein [Anaerolineae bacterium]